MSIWTGDGPAETVNTRRIARNPDRVYPWPRTIGALDREQRQTVEAEAARLGIAPEAQLLRLYRAQPADRREQADENARADARSAAVAALLRR